MIVFPVRKDAVSIKPSTVNNVLEGELRTLGKMRRRNRPHWVPNEYIWFLAYRVIFHDGTEKKPIHLTDD